MRNFEEELDKHLHTPVSTGPTAPDPTVEAVYDTFGAELLSSAKNLLDRLNRVKVFNDRLEQLHDKGASLEEIRALESEFRNEQPSTAQSPEAPAQSPVPMPPPSTSRSDIRLQQTGDHPVRDWLRGLFSPEPVRKP